VEESLKKKRHERPGTSIDYRIIRGLEEYVHSTLFNEVFLFRDLPFRYSNVWDTEFEGKFDTFFTQFQSLAKAGLPENISKSHSDTLEKWICPILASLGWVSDPVKDQGNLIQNTTFLVNDHLGNEVSLRPSILVCPDDKTKNLILEYRKSDRALAELRNNDPLPICTGYYNSLADRHSGKYNPEADEIGSRGDAYSALGLDHQAIKYLDILNKGWGMATDGAKWRLYCREATSHGSVASYEFDLGRLHNELRVSKSEEHLRLREIAKYFYWFFSNESLCKKPIPFVYRVREDSKVYTNKIEEDLKERFVHAMTIACNAYNRAQPQKSKDAAGLELIQGVAESFIFNLLFIRSCESGRILPLHQDYIPVSLHNLVNKIRDYVPQESWEDNRETLALRISSICPGGFRDDGTELYDYVCNLYELVHKGSENSKKYGFLIHGFKEGLFDRDELKFFERTKIDNRSMVQLLFELLYTQNEGDTRSYFQVAFSSFSPRQLGSIYESFLEYKLDLATETLYYVKKQSKERTWWQWLPTGKVPQKLVAANLYSVRKGELVFTPDNSERKATGSYYTPDYIVDYIVQQTLSPLVEEQKNGGDIREIKVCDPAMGSGHFLLGALEFLTEHYVRSLSEKKYVELRSAKHEILKRCLFGMDINKRAVKIAKLSLWLATANAGQELEHLDDQLLNGDSLHDSKGKQSSCQQLIKSIGRSFDAVIGNPPYLGEKGHKELFRATLAGNPGLERVAKGKMDYFYFFLFTGVQLLRPNGRLGFITTAYWKTADGAEKLRSFLSQSVKLALWVELEKIRVFKSATGQHNLIQIFEKNVGECSFSFKRYEGPAVELTQLQFAENWKEETLTWSQKQFGEKPWVFGKANSRSVRANLVPLGEVFHVGCGVRTTADTLSEDKLELLSPKVIKEHGLEKGSGIFVLSKEEKSSLMAKLTPREKTKIKRWYKNSDVLAFRLVPNKELYHVYLTNKDNPKDYPNLVSHLKVFYDVLTYKQKHYEEENAWYAVNRASEESVLKKEKAVTPYRSTTTRFFYTDKELFGSMDLYYLTYKDEKKKPSLTLKALSTMLNSKYYSGWCREHMKRKGDMIEFYATPLNSILIPSPDTIPSTTVNRLEEIYDLLASSSDPGAEAELLEEVEKVVRNLVTAKK